MNKKVLIGVIVAVLVAAGAALFFAKPELFQGSAFKKFPFKITRLVLKPKVVLPCVTVPEIMTVIYNNYDGREENLHTANQEYDVTLQRVFSDHPAGDHVLVDIDINETQLRGIIVGSNQVYKIKKENKVVGNVRIYGAGFGHHGGDWAALKISELPPAGRTACLSNEDGSVIELGKDESTILTTAITNHQYSVSAGIMSRAKVNIAVRRDEDDVFDVLLHMTANETRDFVDKDNNIKGAIETKAFVSTGQFVFLKLIEK